MNLNLIKLRNIVNKDSSFYNESDSESEEDQMNKYESDEESNPRSMSFEEDNEEEANGEIKPAIEDTKEEAVTINTYIRSIDKGNLPDFKWKEDSEADDSLIFSVNSVTADPDSFNAFLLYFKDKLCLEDESISFFSQLFTFFLKKVFYFLKLNVLTPEITGAFNLINDIAFSFIQKGLCIHFRSESKNVPLDKAKIGRNKENESLFKTISVNMAQLCDYALELHLSLLAINSTLSPPRNFFSLSLQFIQIFLEHGIHSSQGFIFIKKYIETFSELIANMKKFNLAFSIEEYKDLFSICFELLKRAEFSNIFIIIIDLICSIVEIVNEGSFEEKFIENMLLCFEEFLNHSDYGSDKCKYYQWNCKLLRNFKFYFGEYNSLGGESISLFTYLFLRFYTVMFAKEDFIKTFERFLVKLLEWVKPRILLCLVCLMSDLLKVKYNVEFSIVLLVITNLYLTVLNLISHRELDVNKRKLMINLIDYFFDDLLEEFNGMREAYFCLGDPQKDEEEKAKKDKEAKKKKRQRKGKANVNDEPKILLRTQRKNCICKCFSCEFTTQKRNHFNCSQCHCRINLRFQLIDPEKDDNKSICGFCNIKALLDNCGMPFEEEERKLQLIDTNEDLLEEYSKSKQKQALTQQLIDSNNKGDKDLFGLIMKPPIDLFDKFVYYQDLLYQNAFLFLRINLINFIRLSINTDNVKVARNIDNSFKIFLKVLVNEQKMKNAAYKNFIESILQFYTNQKERIYCLNQDIQIDDLTIRYFFFFHFYVNFLFAGHWKIVNLALSEKHPWMIRSKSLRILEKFIRFEGNSILFPNFEVGMLSPLLSDNSSNIREFSLDILFKLFKNGRIERGLLIFILLQNIHEASFLIRKRIIKALGDLVLEENEGVDELKTVILVFFNKVNDGSESEKIKRYIYDFFTLAFKASDELKFSLIEVLISLLNDNEDSVTGINLLYDSIKDLFNQLSLSQKAITTSIDYLVEKYLFNKGKDRKDLLQALNVLRILTHYEQESTLVYIEVISSLLKPTEKKGDIVDRIDNKISESSCGIMSNLFDERNKEPIKIKVALIQEIESRLMMIILTKPSYLMSAAIEVYFKMIHRGMFTDDKINSLTLQNYSFLLKHYSNGSTSVQVPEAILSKSISLLSYIIYSIKDDNTLKVIFSGKSIENTTDDIFNLLVHYTMRGGDSINLKAFESLGFFWIRYPSYLSQSTEVIDYVINHLASERDKIILLRTFYLFFSKISSIITINKSKKKQNRAFDFGIIHLFFEQFISKFSIFLINDLSDAVRSYAIHFIKLVVDLGNVNVHNVLPHVFASLFDIKAEIRVVAVGLVEKVMEISSEKFFGLMKECLRFSYAFQKNYFVDSKYFTSFVKERANNKEEGWEIHHTSENIFELLNYKTGKAELNASIQMKLLGQFISAFSEMASLENSFTSESSFEQLKDSIDQFEYYEYIAKLIGDFKYSCSGEVLFVYDKLFSAYETNYCVFKSKVKQYKERENKGKDMAPIEIKNIFYFLRCSVESALLKFLLLKYNVVSDETLQEVKTKGWVTYRKEKIEKEGKGSGRKSVLRKKKELQLSSNKDFFGVKFYEFYSAFNEYIKKVFAVQIKRKFTKKDKELLIELFGKLKAFNDMKITQIHRTVRSTKKKHRGDWNGLFYELFFKLEEDDKRLSSKIDCTGVKLRKRMHLDDSSENKKENKEGKPETKDSEDEDGLKKRFKSKKRKMNKRITIQ